MEKGRDHQSLVEAPTLTAISRRQRRPSNTWLMDSQELYLCSSLLNSRDRPNRASVCKVRMDPQSVEFSHIPLHAHRIPTHFDPRTEP